MSEHERLFARRDVPPDPNPDDAPGVPSGTQTEQQPPDRNSASLFSFAFEGEVDLSIADIWPDGDAPPNPTAQDVIARIQGRWGRIDTFIREWNLGDDIHLYVNSEKAL